MLIHIALIVMVIGALITHFFGIQGALTLSRDGEPTNRFEVSSGPSDGSLPFEISLVEASTLFYSGTTTPMDFNSTIMVRHSDGATSVEKIAMNRVATVDGWRFYQSGMGEDSSTLAVAYDPVGIAVTYTGYALLFISMILFLFQKRTMWRGWVKKLSTVASLLMLFSMSANAGESAPATIQRPLAKNFGKIYVYWNDRVSPMQTMARDVTRALYGSDSYKGLTPEQVLTGWLLYYDEWERDFELNQPEESTLSAKKRKRLAENRALIRWLGTGEAFKIYPYHAATGRMEWLSLAGSRPSKMDMEQWKFMVSAMGDIAADIALGKNIRANERISMLIKKQKYYAGADSLPSDTHIKAEIFYNNYIRLLPLMIILLITGLITIILTGNRKKWKRYRLDILISVIGGVAALYLLLTLTLRGYVASTWPLTNGAETMLFIAFCATAGSVFVSRRFPLVRSGLIFVAGAALAVAVMGDAHPRIGALMPVLASPLLSIHVMLVALSYALFFLMAVIAAKGLFSKKESSEATLNHVLLIPALFLLTAGIFVGAIWANQSWGRYWGWDPKETCALITMFVYALPAHSRSLKCFRKEKTFNLYILIAFGSVLFTYFGANFLLPGLHSYA